jgi:hypothetical protein
MHRSAANYIGCVHTLVICGNTLQHERQSGVLPSSAISTGCSCISLYLQKMSKLKRVTSEAMRVGITMHWTRKQLKALPRTQARKILSRNIN